MPHVLLFGATGYTGALTARALARRGVSFGIAGRSRDKLERLAAETGDPPVHVVSVGDVDGLVRALDGADALLTCVGPFLELGDTAAEAAVRAGVHYLDSTGEGPFVEHLVQRYDERARRAGIVMAPAMGFDEVPADVAATLAVDGFERAELTLTYAFPTHISSGTMRTTVRVLAVPARWIRHGESIEVPLGAQARWAPLPPPYGPQPSMSFPFSIGYVAPLHLDLERLEIYGVGGRVRRVLGRAGTPLAGAALKVPGVLSMIDRLLPSGKGPNDRQRQTRWALLAEGRSDGRWRNVALMGKDVYGLTAELLAAGAAAIASGPRTEGVAAPVAAVGVEILHKELLEQGVSLDVYEPE